MIEQIAKSINEKCGISVKITKTINGKAVVETDCHDHRKEINYFPSYLCALNWLAHTYNLKDIISTLADNSANIKSGKNLHPKTHIRDVDFYIDDIIARIRTFDYVSTDHIDEIVEMFTTILSDGISRDKLDYIHKQVLSRLLSLSERAKSSDRKRYYAIFESKLEQLIAQPTILRE